MLILWDLTLSCAACTELSGLPVDSQTYSAPAEPHGISSAAPPQMLPPPAQLRLPSQMMMVHRRLTWISAGVEGDVLAVYIKTVLAALDCSLICSVDCVVLEHVCCVLRVTEGVIDGYDLDIRVLHRSSQDKPADPAEPIDADLDLRTLYHDEFVWTQEIDAAGIKRVACRLLRRLVLTS